MSKNGSNVNNALSYIKIWINIISSCTANRQSSRQLFRA